MGHLGWCVTLSKCFALHRSYRTSAVPQTGIIVLSVNKKKQISYKTASILNVSCFNRNWRTSKSQSGITEGEFFFHLQFHVSYKNHRNGVEKNFNILTQAVCESKFLHPVVSHTADTRIDTSIGQLKCSHCLNPKPPTSHLPQCLTTVIFKCLIRCNSASSKTTHLETMDGWMDEWFMALAGAQRISQQSAFGAAQSGLQISGALIHIRFPVCCFTVFHTIPS